MDSSSTPGNGQGNTPRRFERMWGLLLLLVVVLAVLHQTTALWSGWAFYVEGFDAVRACQDRLCAVESVDALLRMLSRGVVVLYFFLFALLERVPVVNVFMRVAGCLLFPVFGQVLLPMTRCWIYMCIGAAAMAAGAQLGPGYGEYAFGGTISATLMLARLFVLRENSPWEGAAWGLVSSLWGPGRQGA